MAEARSGFGGMKRLMPDEPIIDLASDHYFMGEALRQALRAAEREEVPVGAVVVFEGRVIARAFNQVELLKDATAHAEMLVLTQAQQVVGDWRLTGCDLYVTKEPCAMCAGGIVAARIERVVFGCPDPKGGAAGSVIDVFASEAVNHRVQVVPGVLAGETAAQLRAFFERRRQGARERGLQGAGDGTVL